MSADYRAPKGTADMLPEVADVWEHMLRVGAGLFSRYGYRPIYTPVFEHTEVFARGIGEATDIVSKEMYTFPDRSKRSLTLRPEGTAGVVRAALEHGLVPPGAVAKYYYAGPMFRYERPQKGRMRQFWQIGLEALGAAEPSADAEAVVVLMRFFEESGIPPERMRLLVNTMGDEACRPAYRGRVAAHIRRHSGALCEDCRRRADTNPLRAFDCKKPDCAEVMSNAPLLRDALCDACAEHYASFKAYIAGLGIAFEEDFTLVRGLDYYTRTVFEVQAEGLGAQNAIGGGGRYDRLMETYGGPPTPGLGWALGFERTLLALRAAGAEAAAPERAEVFVARVDASAAEEAFAVASTLRDAGIAVELDHQARSLKAQFKQADKLGARFVVIIGPDELARGEATVRHLATGEQSSVAPPALSGYLKRLLGSQVDGTGGPGGDQ